ncbi:MAG: hypothetical protein JWL69_2853 [Phycisphaerales bacterium]|nr:hypothetical protein [Phycisphaerales bacterium]MDB5357452.1 hypothetical protein [Phycisphaerales bacterium]
MKRIAVLLTSLLLGGCASSTPHPAAPVAATSTDYEPAAASALAFDSPVAAAYPLPGLARGPREPGAFVGYQDSVIEFFSVGLEDHQSDGDWFDGYDRWSYTVKSGVRYR